MSLTWYCCCQLSLFYIFKPFGLWSAWSTSFLIWLEPIKNAIRFLWLLAHEISLFEQIFSMLNRFGIPHSFTWIETRSVFFHSLCNCSHIASMMPSTFKLLFLRSLKCSQLQNYHWGKEMGMEEALASAKQNTSEQINKLDLKSVRCTWQ